MIDKQIYKTIKELNEIIRPKALKKIESHITSLIQKINDLIDSRDDWKAKYYKLKGETKK